MKKIFKTIGLLTIFLIVPFATAGQEDSHGTIKNIYVYTQYGEGGDVIVQVSNPSPNCGGGLWLNPQDPGFDSALSFLLSGYHTKSTFHFSGDNTKVWAGSGAKYCLLTSVGLRQ